MYTGNQAFEAGIGYLTVSHDDKNVVLAAGVNHSLHGLRRNDQQQVWQRFNCSLFQAPRHVPHFY